MPSLSSPLANTVLPRLRLNTFLIVFYFFFLRLDLYRWIKRSFASLVMVLWNALGGSLRRRKVEWAVGWVEFLLYIPLLLNIAESIYILVSTAAPTITPDGPTDPQTSAPQRHGQAGGASGGRSSSGVLYASRPESPALHRFIPSADSHPPLSSAPSSLRSRTASSRRREGDPGSASPTSQHQLGQGQANGSGPGQNGAGPSVSGNMIGGSGGRGSPNTKSILGQGMGTRPINIGGGAGGSYAPNTPSRLGIGSSVAFALADTDTSDAINATSDAPIISPTPQRLSQPISARQMLAQSQSSFNSASTLGYGGESLLDLNASANSLSARARLRTSLPGSGSPAASKRIAKSEVKDRGGAAEASQQESGGIDPLLWSTFQVRHASEKGQSGLAQRGSPGRGGLSA